MIRAEAHSDDHARKALFDATKWFEQASEDDIKELAKCEWGGDYPADRVAEFMEQYDTAQWEKATTVADVFDYLSAVNNDYREMIGFECEVDNIDALAWLKTHRPQIYESLTQNEEN